MEILTGMVFIGFHATRPPPSPQLPVRPVTKRHLAGMFAGAPGDGLRLGYFNLLWRKAGSFVRAVAKGLRFRSPAGAPPVSARLDFLHDRRFLIDDWIRHKLY